MAIRVDPSTFEGHEWGRPFTPGWQPGKVLTAEEYQSQKGNDCLKLTFAVAGPKGGVKVDKYVVTSGGRFKDFLEVLAPEYLDGGDLEPEVLVGRTCEVEVRPETDQNGQPRAAIAGFRVAPTSGRRPTAPAPRPASGYEV